MRKRSLRSKSGQQKSWLVVPSVMPVNNLWRKIAELRTCSASSWARACFPVQRCYLSWGRYIVVQTLGNNINVTCETSHDNKKSKMFIQLEIGCLILHVLNVGGTNKKTVRKRLGRCSREERMSRTLGMLASNYLYLLFRLSSTNTAVNQTSNPSQRTWFTPLAECCNVHNHTQASF